MSNSPVVDGMCFPFIGDVVDAHILGVVQHLTRVGLLVLVCWSPSPCPDKLEESSTRTGLSAGLGAESKRGILVAAAGDR